MGDGGPHAELHVAVQPDCPRRGRARAACTTSRSARPTRRSTTRWTARLSELRIPNSGEIDRYYFRSLYFREPNGILFEIATDGPGFAVDEDPATLGECCPRSSRCRRSWSRTRSARPRTAGDHEQNLKPSID
jgi:glyoxalase family protein